MLRGTTLKTGLRHVASSLNFERKEGLKRILSSNAGSCGWMRSGRHPRIGDIVFICPPPASPARCMCGRNWAADQNGRGARRAGRRDRLALAKNDMGRRLSDRRVSSKLLTGVAAFAVVSMARRATELFQCPVAAITKGSLTSFWAAETPTAGSEASSRTTPSAQAATGHFTFAPTLPSSIR